MPFIRRGFAFPSIRLTIIWRCTSESEAQPHQ